MSSGKPLKVLVPRLPTAASLLPLLMRIDENRHYSNFGPLNDEFEKALAPIPAASHVVTVSSGTLGLEVALAASNLAPGGEVLLPSLTFSATAAAVVRSRLTPLFGDVDDTFGLTPRIARRIAAERPLAAVLTVSIHGHIHDTREWDAFTADTGIPVIIDAAGVAGFQKVGATTCAVFSLHATKPLSAGEGGFIATRDAAFAERARRLSNFGFEHGQSIHVGTNAKLSEYHAAVGLAALNAWPDQMKRRARLYADYVAALDELGPAVRPATLSRATSNFCVLLDRRIDKRLIEKMARAGIETRRWYWPPLHRHAAYRQFPCADGLPVTERLADRLLGLPFHLDLDRDDVERVCRTLAELTVSVDA